MAREIIAHSWCDVCLADDVREPGDSIQVMLGADFKPRVIELCEAHRKTFVDPLRDLVQEHGRVPEDPTRPRPGPKPRQPLPVPVPCLVPGCRSLRKFADRNSLSAHARHVHGITLKEYSLTYGATARQPELELPIDDSPRADQTGNEYRCDVEGCDKVYVYPENRRPAQALGVHKRRAHGIRAAG